MKEVAVVMKRCSKLFLAILLACGSTAFAGTDPAGVAGQCDESGSLGRRRAVIAGSRLGVRLQGLTPQLAEYFGLSRPAGALISIVEEKSPAEEAGLKAGDIIISVGGERVEDPSDATLTIWRKPSGPVEIVVVRDKQEMTFTAKLEKGARTWVLMPGKVREVTFLPPRLVTPAFKFKAAGYTFRTISKPVVRARPPRVLKLKREKPKIKVAPARARRGTILL
jgi:membrane-associated protease RseP (regulator of RpoE activity)